MKARNYAFDVRKMYIIASLVFVFTIFGLQRVFYVPYIHLIIVFTGCILSISMMKRAVNLGIIGTALWLFAYLFLFFSRVQFVDKMPIADCSTGYLHSWYIGDIFKENWTVGILQKENWNNELQLCQF